MGGDGHPKSAGQCAPSTRWHWFPDRVTQQLCTARSSRLQVIRSEDKPQYRFRQMPRNPLLRYAGGNLHQEVAHGRIPDSRWTRIRAHVCRAAGLNDQLWADQPCAGYLGPSDHGLGHPIRHDLAFVLAAAYPRLADRWCARGPLGPATGAAASGPLSSPSGSATCCRSRRR